MSFSIINSSISYCFTHRRKAFPIFHAIDVLSLLFLCIYLGLALSSPNLTNHSTGNSDCHSDPLTPLYPFYQPVPHPSVCQSLDSLPLPFFTKCHIFSLRLTSKRHVNFAISLLLILAGDVELNPGPPASASNFVAHCLNIRSASSITATCNKPELTQQYILDENIDALFLTETWWSPDTPPSVLNLSTPLGYCIQHIPRPSGRGGGIAAIFRSTFITTVVKTPSFLSFEHMLLSVKFGCKSSLLDCL